MFRDTSGCEVKPKSKGYFDMIIKILDDETIEVLGTTREKAHKNAIKLIKFIGNDRWRSIDGMTYRNIDGILLCMNKVKFSKAPEDAKGKSYKSATEQKRQCLGLG
jgi:uncharacterized ferredoxin-like protein